MTPITRITGVAYQAMQYTYRRPLVTVQENTVTEYLESVKKQPNPSRPDNLSNEDVEAILRYFTISSKSYVST